MTFLAGSHQLNSDKMESRHAATWQIHLSPSNLSCTQVVHDPQAHYSSERRDIFMILKQTFFFLPASWNVFFFLHFSVTLRERSDLIILLQQSRLVLIIERHLNMSHCWRGMSSWGLQWAACYQVWQCRLVPCVCVCVYLCVSPKARVSITSSRSGPVDCQSCPVVVTTPGAASGTIWPPWKSWLEHHQSRRAKGKGQTRIIVLQPPPNITRSSFHCTPAGGVNVCLFKAIANCQKWIWSDWDRQNSCLDGKKLGAKSVIFVIILLYSFLW